MLDRKFVAIDPGKATGIAEYSVGNDFIDLYTMDKPEAYLFITNQIGRNSVLIVEKFIINARTARLQNDPDTFNIIGACDLTAWNHDIPIIYQAPTVRVSGQVLKETFGFHQAHTPHEYAAVGHLTAALSTLLPTPLWKEYQTCLKG